MTSRYKIEQPIKAALGAWVACKPGSSEAQHYFAELQVRIAEACERAAEVEREKAIRAIARLLRVHERRTQADSLRLAEQILDAPQE
jgi:hypothetical protein